MVVRGAQSGFVRAYALLLIGGFAALGLYFLIVAMMRSCRRDDPACCSGCRSAPASLCFAVPRRAVPAVAVLGTLGTLALCDRASSPASTAAPPGSSTPSTRAGSPPSACATSSASTGSASSCILLTALMWAGATAFSVFRMPERRRIYFFMLGLAETAALGAFLAQDLLLFVLFFDLMLVPFWFLIGAFGGENRIAATTKMIVYTLVGSLLMLVAAIATAVLASGEIGHISFSLADLRANTLVDRQPVLDLLLLRRRVPDQDAGVPRPRLDAGRLPGRAAAGPRAALRRALEGRRLRLPARGPAALPATRRSTSRR